MNLVVGDIIPRCPACNRPMDESSDMRKMGPSITYTFNCKQCGHTMSETEKW